MNIRDISVFFLLQINFLFSFTVVNYVYFTFKCSLFSSCASTFKCVKNKTAFIRQVEPSNTHCFETHNSKHLWRHCKHLWIRRCYLLKLRLL